MFSAFLNNFITTAFFRAFFMFKLLNLILNKWFLPFEYRNFSNTENVRVKDISTRIKLEFITWLRWLVEKELQSPQKFV